jgi:hypothetical protein
MKEILKNLPKAAQILTRKNIFYIVVHLFGYLVLCKKPFGIQWLKTTVLFLPWFCEFTGLSWMVSLFLKLAVAAAI